MQMDTEDEQQQCLICLQEACDVQPPCGAIQRLMFHQACLDLLSLSATRCPHCNVTICHNNNNTTDIESQAERALSQLLDQWPSMDGPTYWVRTYTFIPIQTSSLLTTETELMAMNALRRTARSSMTTDPKSVVQTANGLSRRANGIETVVGFHRAAIVGNQGIVLGIAFDEPLTCCFRLF